MPIEIFSKETFEAAIPFKWECLGLKNGEYSYKLSFGNPHCAIELRSSVGPSGISAELGEDSIRAWLIGDDTANPEVIGAKTQRWVTRQANWRVNMNKMLTKLANLGRWIQPCPTCNKLLRLAKGKNHNKGKIILSCWTKENGNFANHVKPTWLDPDTGEEIQAATPPTPQGHGNCPTCNTPLRRVQIKNGSNAGKFALTCPKQENGRYLNHLFQVEE